jgi:pSer/pThr/pTyr-binding forkhead associated (FHA) protein
MMNNLKVKLVPEQEIYPIIILKDGVFTIGRSASCDFAINSPFLSNFHSTIRIEAQGIILTDLDSTNGTFVNDQKVQALKLNDGDKVRFGSIRYSLKFYQTLESDSEKTQLLKNDAVLEFLGTPNLEIPGEESLMVNEKTQVYTPQRINEIKKAPKSLVDIFPEFEFSEFIFEESLEGRAFRKASKRKCLEVTSLFGNLIYKVDYLPLRKGRYFISNNFQKNTLVLPLVNLAKKVPFFEFKNKNLCLIDNEYYKTKVFPKIGDPFDLKDDYILDQEELAIGTNGNHSIYLRLTNTPPRTLPFSGTKSDRSLIVLFCLFFALWLGVSSYLILNPPEEKEEKKEEISKKIDRILYKKKILQVEKLEQKPQVQSSFNEDIKAQPVIEKKPERIKETMVETVQTPPAPPIEKVEPTPVSPPAPPTVNQRVVRVSETAKIPAPPAFDSSKFKNKLSKFLSKVKVSKEVAGPKLDQKIYSNSSASAKGNAGIIQAKARNEATQGSNIGEFGDVDIPTSGGGQVLGFDGLSGKRTVILGALDPRDIQNILKKHVPRFAYCYERELERKNERMSTTLDLKFTIKADGAVSKYSFTANNQSFSATAIRCFSRVLTSINFPKHRGGGVVKVRQPMNLEPKF